jgi:apolipoprotein N-acyltransferase
MGAGVGTSLLAGLAYGLAFFGLTVQWVSVIAAYATVALIVFQALYYAGFAVLVSRVSRLPGFPVWAACCLTLTEAARGRWPFGGFTWGRLGYLSVDTTAAGVARLGGEVLTTFCIVLAAAMVALATLRRIRWTLGAVVVVAGPLVAGPVVPMFTTPAGSSVVGYVQGSVPGEGLDFLGRARTVTRNHLEGTRVLAEQATSGVLPAPAFVLWPENSTDLDATTDAPSRAMVDEAAKAAGVPLVIGTLLDGPGPGHVRNASMVWDPVTGPGALYVKRHLVPFGEYVPLRSLLVPRIPLLNLVGADMISGTASGRLDVAGVPIGTMLCFDTAYADSARDDVRDGARLLTVQTNNATYTGTAQPDQQWQITRFDAVTVGRNVVVVSTNGRSGVIGADGTTLHELPVVQQAVDSRAVALRTGLTPAVRIEPALEAGLATVAAIATLVGCLRRGPVRGRDRHAADRVPDQQGEA